MRIVQINDKGKNCLKKWKNTEVKYPHPDPLLLKENVLRQDLCSSSFYNYRVSGSFLCKYKNKE